jgi:hypothetical protein
MFGGIDKTKKKKARNYSFNKKNSEDLLSSHDHHNIDFSFES